MFLSLCWECTFCKFCFNFVGFIKSFNKALRQMTHWNFSLPLMMMNVNPYWIYDESYPLFWYSWWAPKSVNKKQENVKDNYQCNTRKLTVWVCQSVVPISETLKSHCLRTPALSLYDYTQVYLIILAKQQSSSQNISHNLSYEIYINVRTSTFLNAYIKSPFFYSSSNNKMSY